MAHSWGNPRPQPAPKVVSSGSVSKPRSTGWGSLKPQPAPKRVKAKS